MAQQITLSRHVLAELVTEIATLGEFVDWLDGIEARPGLPELGDWLERLDLDVEDLREHLRTTSDGYQRNVLKHTEHYELVVICWRPGQETAIHDHTGSDCAYRVLEGDVKETLYHIDDDGFAHPVSERSHEVGTVIATAEDDVHSLFNDGPADASNLHIYTPPQSQGVRYELAH